MLQGKKPAFALKTKRRKPLKTRIIQSIRGSPLRTVMEITKMTVHVLHNNHLIDVLIVKNVDNL